MSKQSSVIKIVVVGDTAVGKTSIIERFCHQNFTGDHKATVGADFSSKKMTVDNVDVTLQVWDTAGQERYRSLSNSYFRGCEAAMVVYDVTQESTFAKVSYWTDEILKSLNLPSTEGFPLIVVGNKIDCDAGNRAVAKKRAFEVCKGKGLTHMECSAKSGEFVEALFMSAAASAMDRRESGESAIPTPSALNVSLGPRKANRASTASDGFYQQEKKCQC